VVSDPIPVIDIFAGPGGLAEGFAAIRNGAGGRLFDIALSIEKDPAACATLRLRSIRRRLAEQGQLLPYFNLLRGSITREEFDEVAGRLGAVEAACSEVMNAELGKVDRAEVDARIRKALAGAEQWVLIGGPPCQAYSLAGRARRANDLTFAADEKHFLYREYLRILRVHAPPFFLMENVKGLLSSQHGGRLMFDRIFSDLARPSKDVSYEIRSLVKPGELGTLASDEFVIESERFGIPQARHRVILLGVRSDLASRPPAFLEPCDSPRSVRSVLEEMPRIRSRLSRVEDSPEAWKATLAQAGGKVRGWGVYGERKVLAAMNAAASAATRLEGFGAAFVPSDAPPLRDADDLRRWLHVPGLGGVIQHEARRHMPSDLHRYLFAACFAEVFGVSPKLQAFPDELLPDHDSARHSGYADMPFPDRFRVQCGNLPASTVVSHIAKDGHYYIHYDPSQCRSLTVREAARLQTFPDDYFFEGTRTQQYVQVGNAVPPLLAGKIAMVVAGLMRDEGRRPAMNGDVVSAASSDDCASRPRRQAVPLEDSRLPAPVSTR
jgi:DNA (cytosine-5)-methyltransferase 1